MCSNAAELAACLKEVGRPPDSPDELGDYLIALASILEQAQVFYVEGVAWFDMFTAIEATLVAAVVAAEPGMAARLCAHAAELATPQDAAARADLQACKRHLDFHPQGDMVAVKGLLEPSDAEAVSATLAPLARPRTDPGLPTARTSALPASAAPTRWSSSHAGRERTASCRSPAEAART